MPDASLKSFLHDLRKTCDWLFLHGHLLTPAALEQTRRDYRRAEEMLSAIALHEIAGGFFG